MNRCGTTHFGPQYETMDLAPEHETAPESRQRSEGLTTGTSPFELDEGGKPMASRNATPLTGSAAAHLDACDRCLVNTEVPYGGWTEPNGSLVCMYLCSDCGYRWHTSWNDGDA